jgi:hypothetical protein
MFTVSFTGYHVLPFLQAKNETLFIQGLISLIVTLVPLVFSFVAVWKGGSISGERLYRPKYLDDIERQVRLDNEMRIAAESQYTLLPQKPQKSKTPRLLDFLSLHRKLAATFSISWSAPCPMEKRGWP